jgi:hypothetical protein
MSNFLGLDGFPRPKSEDEQISKNINALFRTPNGQQVLKYLRSITIEAVTGGGASDAELRHLEGQRFLVGLIERRVQHGEKVKSNE